MNPNIGMRYLVAATVQTYTPGTSISYTGGSNFAEAVSASLNWERADGRFYGDDVELDSDNSIMGYTLDIEPAGLTDAARALILGETSSTGEYTITDGASPDVGLGYIRVMKDSSGLKYEGWWFYKLKFSANTEETRTKERNMEWRVPTITGVGSGIQLDSTGKMSFAKHKTFTTFNDAKSYLNGMAGIS